MKERIKYIDIARGIAIFLIVIGHSIAYSEHCTLIEKYIYSFHVVLFFILSGYTFKPQKNENFYMFIKKKFIRILLPYFIWSSIFLVPYMLFGQKLSNELGTNGNFNIIAQIKYILYGNGNGMALKQNTPLWFLPALFSMELVYYYIIKIMNKVSNKFKILFCIPIIIISYLSKFYLKIVLPFGLNTVLVLGIFLYLGYLAQILNLFSKDKLFKIPLILLFTIIGSFAGLYNIKVSAANYNYGSLTLAFVSGISLSIVTIYLAFFINKNRILEYIGNKSIDILIFHKILIVIFQSKMGYLSELLKNSNIVLELFLTLLISMISVAFSLVISKIISNVCNLVFKKKKGEI